MTLTEASPLFKAPAAHDEPKRFHKAAWVAADTDFWVGNTEGSFVGSVERLGRRYLARDMFGTDRGTFPTRAQAQADLEAHFAKPTVQARVQE